MAIAATSQRRLAGAARTGCDLLQIVYALTFLLGLKLMFDGARGLA